MYRIGYMKAPYGDETALTLNTMVLLPTVHSAYLVLHLKIKLGYTGDAQHWITETIDVDDLLQYFFVRK